MRDDEARSFLEIHGRSIRGLAAQHYTVDVIEAWTVPVTDETIRGLLKNPDHEIRLIAELDGEGVGFGVLVVENSELRAGDARSRPERRRLRVRLVAMTHRT